MLLSQAIHAGRTLRPESHQEGWPFVRVANEDDLRSDPWGAAVEAVHSPISKRNWTDATYQSDMAYFVAIQRQHFSGYFQTPANCPAAQPRGFINERRKVVSREGEYVTKDESHSLIKPLTSECALILNLAEFIEHAFYVHNWSSGECARAAESYEQGNQIVLAQTFDHYQSESLRATITERLTSAAWQRELQRRRRQTGNRTYVH